MALPRLTRLELQIMDALWSHGASSVREIQERFPEKNRPAYTTVQTMIYRLEAKKAIRRVKKIGNAHIFDALISRRAAQRRLIDELLSFFGGRTQPVMAHLIESGKLTLEDVQEARPHGKDPREVGVGVAEERAIGDVAQEEHPHGREQQGAREHEEGGVAERELEADAHPGGPIHGLLPRGRRPSPCRCGSRRPPPSR